MTLTAQQRQSYADNGYLVVEGLFHGTELTDLQQAVTEMREASRAAVASDDVFDVGPGHCADAPLLRRVKHPHLVHPAFDRAMHAPQLVDRVADLLGGSVRFDHAKLNFKPAGGAAAVEWHQDWAFYPHTNDDLLAVGVMVEDCRPDNGPLMVVPGSHRGPVFDHHHDGRFIGAIDPADIADLLPKAVALTAPAGSVSLHHVRTIHGSRENRSASTRPLLLFSYAAVDAFPVFEKPDLTEFDGRILRGVPTTVARQLALPVRIPEPRNPDEDSIFENQAEVQGRSFSAAATG